MPQIDLTDEEAKFLKACVVVALEGDDVLSHNLISVNVWRKVHAAAGDAEPPTSQTLRPKPVKMGFTPTE